MYHLSVFAYIFIVLVLLSFVLICTDKKNTLKEIIPSAIVALCLVIGTGTLICDYWCGKETIVTPVKLDHRLAGRRKVYMNFSDEQGNNYWGLGTVSNLYCFNIVEPVRITYLPKTRYVLSIEMYCGDIPQISIPGIKNTYKEYNQIYFNEDAWLIACIANVAFIFMYIADKENWFRIR